MPEASILYSVAAVVIAGLVVWVGFVLKTTKEPWARSITEVPALAAPVELPPVVIATEPREAETLAASEPAEEPTAAVREEEEAKDANVTDEKKSDA